MTSPPPSTNTAHKTRASPGFFDSAPLGRGTVEDGGGGIVRVQFSEFRVQLWHNYLLLDILLLYERRSTRASISARGGGSCEMV